MEAVMSEAFGSESAVAKSLPEATFLPVNLFSLFHTPRGKIPTTVYIAAWWG